MVANWDYYDL